jgi:carbamoyltransferase
MAVFANFIEVDQLKADEKTPGIYIERLKDRSPVLVPGLKAQYKLCSDNRQIYRQLFEQGGAEALYYTGGSALNIVANTRIIESNIFKEVFIPPCTEDSGLALGAAAFGEGQKHGEIETHSPYLNNWRISNIWPEYNDEIIAQVAELLLQQKVIGVCNGYGEAGPRALGNRSILALANSKSLANKLSMEKKGREWYRPLAPVALEKNTKYFTEQQQIHLLSKFMLLDFKVLPEKQNELEGAIHADGTARFQTIFARDENPFLFDLLTYLDKKHGVKALINTSFNAGGEPIVHTGEDARKSANKMQLDGLVLNGKFTPL